jgi:predicted amidohydrolase
MKIALGQIDSLDYDLTANLTRHLNMIAEAEQAKADLIVFPELSLSGDELGGDLRAVSLTVDDDALRPLVEASRTIDIVVGLLEREDQTYYNAAFYYAGGELRHRHRKAFLVDYAVFQEGKYCTPGDDLRAFDMNWGRAGLLVCNDVWHSAVPYLMALEGVVLLLIPANSAHTTLGDSLDIRATWEHMNRAYSGMMGCYTVFVNRAGILDNEDGDFPYWGGSEIIGPRGEVVVKAPYEAEALVYGEVDLHAVAAQHANAPILRDARPAFLRDITARIAAEWNDSR